MASAPAVLHQPAAPRYRSLRSRLSLFWEALRSWMAAYRQRDQAPELPCYYVD